MQNDTVCLSDNAPDTCASNFPFFVIDAEINFKEFNGVIGLGPPFASNGPSFVGYLYD